MITVTLKQEDKIFTATLDDGQTCTIAVDDKVVCSGRWVLGSIHKLPPNTDLSLDTLEALEKEIRNTQRGSIFGG